MPTTDPYGQGIQIAQLTDAPDAQTLAQALAGLGSMVPHMVMVYASAAARAAALAGDTAPTAGMTTWLTDVKRLECYDGSSWIAMNPATLFSNTGATAVSGWSVAVWAARQRAGLVTINLAFTRTGSNITPDSSGNIPDTTMGSIPSDYAPQQSWYASCGDGLGSGEARIDADGTVTLRTWVANGVITTGRNINISETYLNE